MRTNTNAEDYFVITKAPDYSFHGDTDLTTHGDIETISDVINAPTGTDKTFWLISRTDEFTRRYSVESAPNWVMKIYNKLVL